MARYGDPMTFAEERTAVHVAGVFSTAVFKELARETVDDSTRRRIALVASCATSVDATLGDAFDQAHAMLTRDYRSEYVFKNGLVSKLIFGRHSPRTATALLELKMGNSWADVVIMNGTSTTYEIKTDLDQLTRLATQLNDYVGRSEFVNVVTSDKRAFAVERFLPSNIGVVAMRRSGALSTIRPARSNRERMTSLQLHSMLRSGEALSILTDLTGYSLDVPPGEASKRIRALFAELDVDAAHRGVVTHLRRRGRFPSQLATAKGFPRSLWALAYASELSDVGRSRVLERLAAPARLALVG